MASSAIVVSIGADVSGLTSGMTEASHSLASVGSAGLRAGEQLTRGGAAFEEAKLAAGAMTGSIEELTRGFAKLAAESPAVSNLLRAAIPVLAIVAAVEVFNELTNKIREERDAVEQLGTEYANWSGTAVKGVESVYQEALKLEKDNPIAIAADEARQKLLQMDEQITKDITDLNKLIETKNIGFWSSFVTGAMSTSDVGKALKQPILDVQEAMNAVRTAEETLELDKINKVSGEQLASDQKAIDKAKEEASARIAALASVAEAQQKLTEQRKAEIEKPIPGDVFGLPKEDIEKRFQPALEMIQQIRLGIYAMQTELSQEGTIASDINNRGYAEALKAGQNENELARKNAQEELTVLERQSAEAKKFAADEASIGKKNAEEELERLERAAAARKKAGEEQLAATRSQIDAIHDEIAGWDADVAAEKRATEVAKAESPHSPAAARTAERAEMAALAFEIANVTSAMKALSLEESKLTALPDKTDQQKEQIKALQGEYDQLLRKLQELQNSYLQLSVKIGTATQSMVNAAWVGFDKFNEGIIRVMENSQSLGRAMQQVWNSIASAVITALLRTVEQMIINAAVQKSITDSTKISEAAAAARRTYASVSAIPYIGWILAPPAAAAAFAAVLAFERGGIIPGGIGEAVPMLGHGQEMVLPAHVSNWVLQAAGARPDGSGGSSNFHYHAPEVSAFDSGGLDRVLNNHADRFGRAAMHYLRRRAM